MHLPLVLADAAKQRRRRFMSVFGRSAYDASANQPSPTSLEAEQSCCSLLCACRLRRSCKPLRCRIEVANAVLAETAAIELQRQQNPGTPANGTCTQRAAASLKSS